MPSSPVADDRLMELFKEGMVSKEALQEAMKNHQYVPQKVKKRKLDIRLDYCPKCKKTGYLTIKYGESMLIDHMPLTENQIAELV